MDADILKVIELIDKKIKVLTVTKQTLINEFGNGKAEVVPFVKVDIDTLRDAVRVTRKDAVKKLIQEQGPQSRREIIEKTGFPDGTVAYVLNDKKRFFSTTNDKWDLVVENRQEN